MSDPLNDVRSKEFHRGMMAVVDELDPIIRRHARANAGETLGALANLSGILIASIDFDEGPVSPNNLQVAILGRFIQDLVAAHARTEESAAAIANWANK